MHCCAAFYPLAIDRSMQRFEPSCVSLLHYDTNPCGDSKEPASTSGPDLLCFLYRVPEPMDGASSPEGMASYLNFHFSLKCILYFGCLLLCGNSLEVHTIVKHNCWILVWKWNVTYYGIHTGTFPPTKLKSDSRKLYTKTTKQLISVAKHDWTTCSNMLNIVHDFHFFLLTHATA